MSSNYRKGFRSVYKLTAHVVLVTKYRKKAINKERLERLKVIFKETLEKWECQLLDFNSESDHCHLIVEFKPDVQLSKLIANLKTVSSRLIRKEYPELSQKHFYGKPYFWTGAYFVASCDCHLWFSRHGNSFLCSQLPDNFRLIIQPTILL